MVSEQGARCIDLAGQSRRSDYAWATDMTEADRACEDCETIGFTGSIFITAATFVRKEAAAGDKASASSSETAYPGEESLPL